MGLECVPPPPSFFSFLLLLQIPCSLAVAKLICNSCAPTLPQPNSGKLKESPRLLPCWAYVIGLGDENVQNTGEPMPPFFLRCRLDCFFPAFSFRILSPLPLRGLCCFSEHWADSDLHCNCCAPPLYPTWKPYQSTKRMTRKCKTNS